MKETEPIQHPETEIKEQENPELINRKEFRSRISEVQSKIKDLLHNPSISRGEILEKQEEIMDDFSVEELLSTDINNFAISYDKIEKVELKKFGKGAFINVIANGKEYHWALRGIPDIKNPKIADLEKILRPIFQEKLVMSSFLKL